jgi:hypothetical protein
VDAEQAARTHHAVHVERTSRGDVTRRERRGFAQRLFDEQHREPVELVCGPQVGGAIAPSEQVGEETATSVAQRSVEALEEVLEIGEVGEVGATVRRRRHVGKLHGHGHPQPPKVRDSSTPHAEPGSKGCTHL